MRATATIAALLMLAAGTLAAQAQTAQTRYDLLQRKPGGVSDFIPNVQSDPAQVIATPSLGIGPSGSSGARSTVCRPTGGYSVYSYSASYCDFRATSLSSGPCECGTYSYYQHYAVGISGTNTYQEIVAACQACPPPIVSDPGGFCGVTGYGEPVPCSGSGGASGNDNGGGNG